MELYQAKLDYFQILLCTAQAEGKPIPFTYAGVYIVVDLRTVGGLYICSTSTQYIDLATPLSDYTGRMVHNNTDYSFSWFVGGTGSSIMTCKRKFMWSLARPHWLQVIHDESLVTKQAFKHSRLYTN